MATDLKEMMEALLEVVNSGENPVSSTHDDCIIWSVSCSCILILIDTKFIECSDENDAHVATRKTS